MDEWYPVEYGIDWLTGEYTNKREKLKRRLKSGVVEDFS